MIDTIRQLPVPSATAWSLALAVRGRPRFVILTVDERHAREMLAAHLTELGHEEAASFADRVEDEQVAVIW